MTATSLAMTGNLDEAILLLIAIANGVDRKLYANLTSFVSISSFVSILSVPSGAMPPLLTSLQLFYGCSEILRTKNFHNFYRLCYNNWTTYGGFSFF